MLNFVFLYLNEVIFETFEPLKGTLASIYSTLKRSVTSRITLSVICYSRYTKTRALASCS